MKNWDAVDVAGVAVFSCGGLMWLLGLIAALLGDCGKQGSYDRCLRETHYDTQRCEAVRK